MMKIAMRLQKSQVTPVFFKWTAGQVATFKRDLYIMAGYTQFDVMVVGGSGGRSGVSSYYIVDPQLGARTDRWYGAGGGGGSSKRVIGSLLDLPTSVDISVGSQGSQGADNMSNGWGGDGGRGGNSSFGSIAIGYGGYGGYSSKGGSSIAVGGEGANPDGSKGPLGGAHYSGINRAAGWGSWDNALKQGAGGGGGQGANITYGGVTYAAQDGGGGSNSGDGYYAGAEAVQASYYGGGGGGCNINPFTGTGNEDYGSGYNHGRGGGVVALRIS